VEIGLYKSGLPAIQQAGLGQGRMESWDDGFKGRKDVATKVQSSPINRDSMAICCTINL